MRFVKALLAMALLAAIGVAGALWAGLYDVAADAPHWSVTSRVLEAARERSIARRAAGIELPDLTDATLIRSGAGNYHAMCVACHLSPDAAETELSIGLYPRPPRWDALGEVDAREAFWVLKHGIKASGMPAWGKSMEDRYLWGMVAFLQQFQTMTAAQYGALVAASSGHSHGGGETEVESGHSAAARDHGPHDHAPPSPAEPAEDSKATPPRHEHEHDAEAHQH